MLFAGLFQDFVGSVIAHAVGDNHFVPEALQVLFEYGFQQALNRLDFVAARHHDRDHVCPGGPARVGRCGDQML